MSATNRQYAQQVFTQIREMQIDNELPQDITTFSQLHDHFDANTGWGDEIDNLPPEVWARVQVCVNEMLCGGYPVPPFTGICGWCKFTTTDPGRYAEHMDDERRIHAAEYAAPPVDYDAEQGRNPFGPCEAGHRMFRGGCPSCASDMVREAI
jgi:hypothetical protein